MIRLKGTKSQSFSVSLEVTFLEKSQGYQIGTPGPFRLNTSRWGLQMSATALTKGKLSPKNMAKLVFIALKEQI